MHATLDKGSDDIDYHRTSSPETTDNSASSHESMQVLRQQLKCMETRDLSMKKRRTRKESGSDEDIFARSRSKSLTGQEVGANRDVGSIEKWGGHMYSWGPSYAKTGNFSSCKGALCLMICKKWGEHMPPRFLRLWVQINYIYILLVSSRCLDKSMPRSTLFSSVTRDMLHLSKSIGYHISLVNMLYVYK